MEISAGFFEQLVTHSSTQISLSSMGNPGAQKPMMVAVVLIELESSDLWRDLLNRSNFDSCEEVLSTEEGRRAVLRCMLDKATHTWPAFLHTPAKTTAAIGGLEVLQCLNTTEVVILWFYRTPA